MSVCSAKVLKCSGLKNCQGKSFPVISPGSNCFPPKEYHFISGTLAFFGSCHFPGCADEWLGRRSSCSPSSLFSPGLHESSSLLTSSPHWFVGVITKIFHLISGSSSLDGIPSNVSYTGRLPEVVLHFFSELHLNKTYIEIRVTDHNYEYWPS